MNFASSKAAVLVRTVGLPSASPSGAWLGSMLCRFASTGGVAGFGDLATAVSVEASA